MQGRFAVYGTPNKVLFYPVACLQHSASEGGVGGFVFVPEHCAVEPQAEVCDEKEEKDSENGVYFPTKAYKVSFSHEVLRS